LRYLARVGAGLAVLVMTAGCSHAASPGQRTPASRPVVVASFNFPESVLLGEIYAEALEHAGVPVRRELDLGTREMVLPAVHQGLVDVVPEYQGSLLAALDPGSSLQGATSETERSALIAELRAWHVELLDAAPAQDQNGLVVTKALAARLGLRATSDLIPVAPRLTLGAPAECPARPFCLVGLERTYGLHFARFEPFDAESQRVAALQQQVVDVALMFTTDGELATGDFVVLDDDRHLQPADNVVPIVSTRAISTFGPAVAAALDAVSSALTQQDIVFLNWRVGVAGKAVPSEARGWLQRHHLVPAG
jgi:osmoprotectant transport system substrate-binding protein